MRGVTGTCGEYLAKYPWLAPLVLAVREGASSVSDVRSLLGCSSSLAKSLVFSASRLGLLEVGGGRVRLRNCSVNPPVYRVMARYVAPVGELVIACRVAQRRIYCKRIPWALIVGLLGKRPGPGAVGRDKTIRRILSVIGQPYR